MRISFRKRPFAGLDAKAIVGSGFLWAWFDALFMSVFFAPSGQQGLMPEAGAIATFVLGVPVYIVALFRSDAVNRLITSRRTMLAIGLAGSFGSLLFMLAGFTGNGIALFAAALLCALFMSFGGLAWGAVYSSAGAASATHYVAGGFAFAFVIDVPLLLMIPFASAVFFALLPIASFLLLLRLDRKRRTYVEKPEEPVAPKGGFRTSFHDYLGMSFPVLGALMLIMVGFGFMQHLVSFSALPSLASIRGGVLIQVVRGIVALAAFAIVIMAPKRVSVMYRVGLLAIVAGFSLMPFLDDVSVSWISGAIIIGGYTTFDLLDWVLFSQVAHARSRQPLKTIAVMRLAVGVCYALGALVGIALSSTVGADAHLHAAAIFVGYLMTVAIVLLLSSKDAWELFAFGASSRQMAARAEEGDDWLAERCEAWGFTQREREIVVLLAVGRTQPWIAENLGISENTVNTHIRHIYQKTGVRSRQDFLDLVVKPSVHDSGDGSDRVA